MSSYEAAMIKLQKSYELRKKHLTENHLLIGDIYVMKCHLFILIGNYQDAEKYSNWANRIYTDHYQLQSHLRIAKLLILKGMIQISIQNGDKALQYCKEAQQTLRTIYKTYFHRNSQKYHPIIEWCEYVTQLSLFTSGKYLEITLSYDSPQFFALFGETLIILSQYQDGLSHLQQAVIRQEKLTNKYHIDTITYQLNLTNGLLLSGNLNEYQQKFQEINDLIVQRKKLFSLKLNHQNDNNDDKQLEDHYQEINYSFESLPFYRNYLISKAKKHHFFEEFYQADECFHELYNKYQLIYGYNHPIVYEIIYEQLVSMTERGSDNLDNLMTSIDNNLKNLEVYYSKEHPKIIKSIYLFTTFCLMYRSEDMNLIRLCYNELQSLNDIILNIYNKTTIIYIHFLRLMNCLNYLVHNYSATRLLIDEEISTLQLIFPSQQHQLHYEFGYCYLNQIILELKEKNCKIGYELTIKCLEIFRHSKGENSYFCKFFTGLQLLIENDNNSGNNNNNNEINGKINLIIENLYLILHLNHPLIRYLKTFKNHTENKIENRNELRLTINNSNNELNYFAETKEKQFENLQNQLNNSINENKILLSHLNEKETLLKISEEENLKQKNENNILQNKIKMLELKIQQQNEVNSNIKIELQLLQSNANVNADAAPVDTRAEDILKKANSLLRSKKIHP